MQEKIYFKNEIGLKLCGILSGPSESRELPIVILCHGFATEKDSSTNIAIKDKLNLEGIATFRFDFFGHKESEGKFEDITISRAVNDIMSAIEYLKSLGYSKIGLEGSSFGGIAAIMAASNSCDLFVLALKCPAIDYYQEELNARGESGMQEWKTRGYVDYANRAGVTSKLKYAYVEDFINHDAFKAGESIKVPTIIALGDKDEYIPVGHAKKLAEAINECRLEIFPDADHKFSKEEDFEKMINMISGFIIKNAM